MNKLISGAMAVEVAVNATSQKFFFPDVPQLRNKRIKHIDIVDIAKSHTGKDIYSAGNIYLTLVEKNTQMEKISKLDVQRLNNNGTRLFINKVVDYQQSFIYLPEFGEDNKVVLFVFWYDEPAIMNIIPMANNNTLLGGFEIKLTASKTYFLENLNLKDRMYQFLFVEDVDYTVAGNAGVALADLENKFLTLTRNGLEFISNLPLILLYQIGKSSYLRFQNIQFDFQSSYITSLTTGVNDLKSIQFNYIVDDNK